MDENINDIREAIKQVGKMHIEPSFEFGIGNSTEVFREIITDESIWKKQIQKRVVDILNE